MSIIACPKVIRADESPLPHRGRRNFFIMMSAGLHVARAANFYLVSSQGRASSPVGSPLSVNKNTNSSIRTKKKTIERASESNYWKCDDFCNGMLMLMHHQLP